MTQAIRPMTTWLGAVLVPVLAAAPRPPAQPARDPAHRRGAAARRAPGTAITLNEVVGVVRRQLQPPGLAHQPVPVFDAGRLHIRPGRGRTGRRAGGGEPRRGRLPRRLDRRQPIPAVLASPGLLRDDDGEAGDFDVHQAFLSYIAPAGPRPPDRRREVR